MNTLYSDYISLYLLSRSASTRKFTLLSRREVYTAKLRTWLVKGKPLRLHITLTLPWSWAQTGRQPTADEQACRQGRHSDRQTVRQSDRQTYIQTDRQTHPSSGFDGGFSSISRYNGDINDVCVCSPHLVCARVCACVCVTFIHTTNTAIGEKANYLNERYTA